MGSPFELFSRSEISNPVFLPDSRLADSFSLPFIVYISKIVGLLIPSIERWDILLIFVLQTSWNLLIWTDILADMLKLVEINTGYFWNASIDIARTNVDKEFLNQKQYLRVRLTNYVVKLLKQWQSQHLEMPCLTSSWSFGLRSCAGIVEFPVELPLPLSDCGRLVVMLRIHFDLTKSRTWSPWIRMLRPAPILWPCCSWKLELGLVLPTHKETEQFPW